MSQTDLRDSFLKSWQPYPTSLEGVCVRVVSMQPSVIELELEEGEPGALLLGDGDSWPLLTREGHIWRSQLSFGELQSALRPGDWLLVRGTLSLAKQWREKDVEGVLLLAPNRHGDFIPFQQQRSVLHWSRFIEDVRRFFKNEGFLSIETPHLVVSSGLEPHLEPFVTSWKRGEANRPLYLPTSPELHLKKLLCRGFRKVFEIKKVFRNEDLSPHHQPEFLMLEWYRAMATLDSIESDIAGLLHFLKQSGWGHELPSPQLERVSVRALFARFLDIELQPNMTDEALRKAAQKQYPQESFAQESFDDLFHRLWVDFIDPKLKNWPALIVFDYPPSQAALARLTPEGWADRRELYINGIEIANGYFELNDPDEQRRRFENDVKLRAELGRTPISIDEDFLKHLEQGMPPAAGIALGMERLFMALKGYSKLTEFLPFPHQNTKM
jgi:lysyl-tRNA synthetase class 2